jgi:hypothetical protein
MWSTPIDLYCERLDPSFWAEPVNALSNVAFLLTAAAAFRQWQRRGQGDRVVLALIAVVVLVGIGSFAFHTLATRGAMLLDVGPIGLFIYGYFLLALRRFLALRWTPTVVLFAAFVALSTALAVYVPRSFLSGSAGYFPALAALIAVGWLAEERTAGRMLLAAAAVFAGSLFFRIVDLEACNAFAPGAHFLWHILNAVVLYLVLAAALGGRERRGS